MKMEIWMLVIVLTAPSNVEQHVAIFMPNEETCQELSNAYVYAVDIRPPVATEEDPFADLDGDLVRTPIPVDEVRCKMVVTDD
jgi:hypothetical protein